MIGRESELAFLANLWDQKGLTTCCIWGRRRIGKTALLREFGKGKRTLHLQGVKGSYYENLSSLSLDLSYFLGEEYPTAPDLSHLMRTIEDICREERTLVVIDELPYLLESAPQASSVIQKSLDTGLKGIDCMFVVCGSSISVMRKETENAERPLFGRFENTLQVKQLSIGACREFHPDLDDETSLRWYCTVGGIPFYHLNLGSEGYEGLVQEKFFGTVGIWRNDAPSIILQEFNGNTKYTGIVKCIADGYVRQAEIADKMKMDAAGCKRALDDLEFVGIVGRRVPMGGSPKKPVYFIRDPFIAFCYGAMLKNLRLVERDSNKEAAYDIVRNDIDTQIGRTFEMVCGDWLDSAYLVVDRGQWWGRLGDSEADIDIVAKVSDGRGVIRTVLGECKFSRKPMGFGAYNALSSRATCAGLTENAKYMLFSALGFDEDLVEYAADNGIALIGSGELMGRESPPRLFDREKEGVSPGHPRGKGFGQDSVLSSLIPKSYFFSKSFFLPVRLSSGSLENPKVSS